jgi:glycosyltransferase involved in cell wall biosynthesis
VGSRWGGDTCRYQSFRSQTYPHIELVVIDDVRQGFGFRGLSAGLSLPQRVTDWDVCTPVQMGPRSRVLSYSNDRRIQYIQAQRLTVGEKRNLALTMAKGSVVAHFDDDDLCAPLALLPPLVGDREILCSELVGVLRGGSYGPEYLELMLSQLTRTCAQMITLSAWMWYVRMPLSHWRISASQPHRRVGCRPAKWDRERQWRWTSRLY